MTWPGEPFPDGKVCSGISTLTSGTLAQRCRFVVEQDGGGRIFIKVVVEGPSSLRPSTSEVQLVGLTTQHQEMACRGARIVSRTDDTGEEGEPRVELSLTAKGIELTDPSYSPPFRYGFTEDRKPVEFAELYDHEQRFYEEQGLDWKLPKYEDMCAVIFGWGSATEEALRGLGKALADWKAGQPHVRRIIGLADMLQGRRPTCASFLLWGSRYYMRADSPTTWQEPNAIVTMAAGASGDFLTGSVGQVVEASGIGQCLSISEYSYNYK